MSARETQILRRLAVLVVCHGLSSGHPQYFLVQRSMSWDGARVFCRRHYADLLVLSSLNRYVHFVDRCVTDDAGVWLGLRRQTEFDAWEWVDGQELWYRRWHRNNDEGRCASLEAKAKDDRRMLARYCDELHMFVCQGPDSLEAVNVDSVDSDYVSLRWNVSALMQMTPHNYSVTVCGGSGACVTRLYGYSHGAAVMSVNISDLAAATRYVIEIYAFVVRPDNKTGGKNILKSSPTALQVKTDSINDSTVVIIVLTSFKLLCLVPLLWVVYYVLRKHELKECEQVLSSVETCDEETTAELMSGTRTRGVG